MPGPLTRDPRLRLNLLVRVGGSVLLLEWRAPSKAEISLSRLLLCL